MIDININWWVVGPIAYCGILWLIWKAKDRHLPYDDEDES